MLLEVHDVPSCPNAHVLKESGLSFSIFIK